MKKKLISVYMLFFPMFVCLLACSSNQKNLKPSEGYINVKGGKVWYKGDDSDGWHRGYGAGVYFAPLEQRYALNILLGHSKEEAG